MSEEKSVPSVWAEPVPLRVGVAMGMELAELVIDASLRRIVDELSVLGPNGRVIAPGAFRGVELLEEVAQAARDQRFAVDSGTGVTAEERAWINDVARKWAEHIRRTVRAQHEEAS